MFYQFNLIIMLLNILNQTLGLWHIFKNIYLALWKRYFLDNLWKCKTYYAAFGAGQSSLEIPLNIDESFKIHSITSTLNSNDGNIGPNSQVYLISGNKLKVILFLAGNIYTVKINAGFMIAVWYSIEN